MDLILLFEKQVGEVTKSAFYHLHLACQLLLFIDSADLAMLIHAFVTLWLDWCNALYMSCP